MYTAATIKRVSPVMVEMNMKMKPVILQAKTIQLRVLALR